MGLQKTTDFCTGQGERLKATRFKMIQIVFRGRDAAIWQQHTRGLAQQRCKGALFCLKLALLANAGHSEEVWLVKK